MELKVIGKRLFTNGLDGTVTEGENGADVIGITLERYHGKLDLSEFSFRITAACAENGVVAEQTLETDSVTDTELHLLWSVTSAFTAESGSYAITLAGIDSDNVTQIKFTAQPVSVNADSRMEFLPHPTLIEQSLNQIQLETQKALDAAKRAEEAADGIIPAASKSRIGGIKAGGDVSVASDGVVTVNSVNGKTVEASVPADAKFTDTVYTLPAANQNTLGGVIPDGKTIVADENGVISAKGGGGYSLPVATARVLGGVMVDGVTITADENGVISSAGGGSAGGEGMGNYVLPVAAQSTLGGVMPDNTTISAEKNGVISVKDNSHSHTIANVTGLQSALDGKADVSAIPEALPANGGNADTVGGFTVKSNVPANAKFTDTVYTLPKATSLTLGGVIPDGETISVDSSGVISAAAAAVGGGSGVTIERVIDINSYWENATYSAGFIKLSRPVTDYDYIVFSGSYFRESMDNFGSGIAGTYILDTKAISYRKKLNAGATAVQSEAPRFYYDKVSDSQSDFASMGYFQFISETVIRIGRITELTILGIILPKNEPIGVFSTNLPT